MLCMGSLTNYKVSDHHTSPASFLHLLFTFHIPKKNTQVFLTSHTVLFLSRIYIGQEYRSHCIFDSPAFAPTSTPGFKRETSFPLSKRLKALKWAVQQMRIQTPHFCEVLPRASTQTHWGWHGAANPAPTSKGIS